MKNKSENKDFFSVLPNEVISKIIAYLDFSGMTPTALISKLMRNIAGNTPTQYSIKITDTTGNEIKRKGTYTEVFHLLKLKHEKEKRLKELKEIQGLIEPEVIEGRYPTMGCLVGLSSGIGGGVLTTSWAMSSLGSYLSAFIGLGCCGLTSLVGLQLGFFCQKKAKEFEGEKKQLSDTLENLPISLEMGKK